MSRYQPELICGDLTDPTSGFPIGHVGRGGRIGIGRGVHRGRGRGRGGGGRRSADAKGDIGKKGYNGSGGNGGGGDGDCGGRNWVIPVHNVPEGSQKKRIELDNAKKIWGTLRSTTCSAVLNAINRTISESLTARLTLKRKYKSSADGTTKKWWLVVRAAESDVELLEREWGKVSMHTGWRLESVYSFEDNVATASVPVAPTLSPTLSASQIGGSTCNTITSVSNVITHSSHSSQYSYKCCCTTICMHIIIPATRRATNIKIWQCSTTTITITCSNPQHRYCHPQ